MRGPAEKDRARHARRERAGRIPGLSGRNIRERLVEALPLGVYVCDPEGNITYFNDAAAELWGRRPKLNDAADRFCGSEKLSSRQGEAIPHEKSAMARTLRDGTPYTDEEVVIRRSDGDSRTALVHASPIVDAAANVIGAINVLVDVTDRAQHEEALLDRERDLDDFFENAPMGLHWVGPDGGILRVNRAELGILGYESDEVVGHHISEFHADADVIADILDSLSDGKTLKDRKARIRCKDGKVRHVLIDSNVKWDADGNFVHTRCFTRDVTDRVEAAEALQLADRRKDEFLAALAHELRNPLGPILNAAALIARSADTNETVRTSAEIIERQARDTARIVDDLLDVARISSGKLELRKEIVALSEVIHRAQETSQPLIEGRRHSLTVRQPDAPVYLHADPVRLSQVFSNLLNNAAKFTEPGGHILLAAELNEDGSLLIRVRDDGIGIDPGSLPEIFEMFEQAGGRRGDTTDGLGVGLALVKSLVSLHGGTASAHSEGRGHGSEFRVTLSTSERPPATPVSEDRPAAMARRRVLIVEDRADAARSLGLLLDHMGQETCIALDGASALTAAKEFGPDLVLLDIGLPDMDGYEVCRRLRAGPDGIGMEIVALTGWATSEDRQKAADAGFNNHIAKPIDPEALRNLLQKPASAGSTDTPVADGR